MESRALGCINISCDSYDLCGGNRLRPREGSRHSTMGVSVPGSRDGPVS